MNRAAVLIAVLLLAACAARPGNVPVINKSPDREIPRAYSAKAGDSIFEISWAFGVDHLDLIKWNRLSKPYLLTPGQVIYLRKPAATATALADDSAAGQSQPVASLPAKQPARTQTATGATRKVNFSTFAETWNWPAEGELSGRFSPDGGSNGIQISGAAGSPVKASAGGEVVYVGEGIRGYGKLIIIKHSEEFLSAYAHNQDILVQEGERVQSGRQIARMGSSGAQRTMLHFEIRKDGKPVDPLGYLN